MSHTNLYSTDIRNYVNRQTHLDDKAVKLDYNLTFILINATSLAKNNAVQLLQSAIISYKINAAIVVETWFSNKQLHSCINI